MNLCTSTPYLYSNRVVTFVFSHSVRGYLFHAICFRCELAASVQTILNLLPYQMYISHLGICNVNISSHANFVKIEIENDVPKSKSIVISKQLTAHFALFHRITPNLFAIWIDINWDFHCSMENSIELHEMLHESKNKSEIESSTSPSISF